MEITSVQAKGTNGAQGATAGSGAAGGSSHTLMNGVSKSDFLKLLVAQLQNQDPMKPMEDKEFISQMAQLNTVEQITNMNNQLTQFLAFEAISQAGAMIGKAIEASPSGGALITGVVQEIRLEQGKPVLIVNGNPVGMGDIRKIAAP